MKIKKYGFKLNRKGFSLVELLAVVVILGLIAAIGIGATSMLVDKAKSEKIETQKNTVTLSAQTYLQNNKNLVPKIIGESKIIKVSDLKRTNYLTEDIKNDKGESCMENSYVRVYKLSNSEYTYTTFLYCGNEEIPAEQDVPTPKVTASFTDSSGEIKDEKLNNVSDAYLYIELNAATEDEIQEYKNMSTDIVIDGYSFTIFVYKNGKKQEVYNSGSLSGGREEKIIINKKLKEYIDVTGVSEVSLEVIAINNLGGITNISTTVGEHGEVSSSQYEDTIPPKCVMPDSPYDEEDWMNKNEYNVTKDARKLTVGCDDGTGSGCIRNYFTQSWPNDDDKKGAEYVIVEVKDNAGNVSEPTNDCRFRVNVDLETPSATVTAYKGAASSSNNSDDLASKLLNSNILNKVIKVSDSSTSNEIKPTIEYYSGLIGNDTSDKWMNKANFPNGVIYKIELTDNIRLDKWTWRTNAGYINDINSSDYKIVSGTNPEATSGITPQNEAHGMTNLHGSTKDVVYVRFLTEGKRYGVFTAYDKSGNKVEIQIAAHLDRTPPPVPESLVAYVYNNVRTSGSAPTSTRYSFKTWTNRYVRVETDAGQNRDNLTDGVTLSGFWQYYYDALNHNGSAVGGTNKSTYASGVGKYDFKGTADQVDGKNKIRFMGCDKANNCSNYGTYKEVWIDITIPQCSVGRSISGSLSSAGWLGINETATVTASCSDRGPNLQSGCSSSSFSHTYSSEINTSSAGARGNGSGGSFTDNAGNSVSCPANQTVKIDYHKPTCSTSGGSTAWTNGNRTVKGTCSDTGGSGCVGNISHTYSSNIATNNAGPAGNKNGGKVYDKADNSGDCAADRPVYIDKTPPTIDFNPANGTSHYKNEGITATATCHDTGGSGLTDNHAKSWSSHYKSPNKGTLCMGHVCEDHAGNITIESACWKIYHQCEHKSCGVKNYNICEAEGCGAKTYKSCYHSNCGTYNCNCKSVCTKWTCENCHAGTCKMYDYNSGSQCDSLPGLISKKCKTSTQKCSTCNKYCSDPACGVKTYKTCEDPACGVKNYKICWHLQH